MKKRLSKVFVYGLAMGLTIFLTPLSHSIASEQVSSQDLMIYGSPRVVQGIYVCDGAPTTCQHPFRPDPTQPITPVNPGTTT